MKKIYSMSFSMMLAMLLVSLMVYGQAPELIAHYSFDEASGTVAADGSGNGFDAAVFTASETPWVEGTIDGALEFAGTDSVILPADVMGMTSNDGSVTFWMNSPGGLSNINTMFWAGDNNTGGGFGPENEMHIHLEAEATDIWLGGECSFFIFGNGTDPNIFIHSDPEKGGPAGNKPVNPLLLGDGEWHHLAATWGDGFAALYIDGVVMWDTSLYISGNYPLNHILLGNMANLGNRAFIGKIDDVRVYKGVLSSLDVEDIFNKNTTFADQKRTKKVELSVFPNPATSNASIRFSAESGRNVSVKLYSITGALVDNLYQGMSVAGDNVVNLDAGNYSSGLYMVELQIGNRVSHTKFILQ